MQGRGKGGQGLKRPPWPQLCVLGRLASSSHCSCQLGELADWKHSFILLFLCVCVCVCVRLCVCARTSEPPSPIHPPPLSVPLLNNFVHSIQQNFQLNVLQLKS